MPPHGEELSVHPHASKAHEEAVDFLHFVRNYLVHNSTIVKKAKVRVYASHALFTVRIKAADVASPGIVHKKDTKHDILHAATLIDAVGTKSPVQGVEVSFNKRAAAAKVTALTTAGSAEAYTFAVAVTDSVIVALAAATTNSPILPGDSTALYSLTYSTKFPDHLSATEVALLSEEANKLTKHVDF